MVFLSIPLNKFTLHQSAKDMELENSNSSGHIAENNGKEKDILNMDLVENLVENETNSTPIPC
jgi:hypothetical protein